MLSDFEIAIYKALSVDEPRSVRDVAKTTGFSRGGCGVRMDVLTDRGFLMRKKIHLDGAQTRLYTLTDLFSIEFARDTGQNIALSDAAKAMIWMRSNRLAKGDI